MRHLSLDLTRLTEHGAAESGIREAELDALGSSAEAAVTDTITRREGGEIGFFDLPEDRAGARSALDYARALPPEVDTMVVLGIGGSSLGPHAVYSALARPFDEVRERAPGMPRRLFFPDNPDPVTFRGLLDLLPMERTVFNVVTKSGGTAETAAQLLVVADRIERELGEKALPRHLVVTTDPEKGALRRLAGELGVPSFAIPPSVGGRFSVLSPVGLLPAAVAGLDVMGLLDGAAAMRDRILGEGRGDVRENPALLLAALLYLHDVKRGRPMVVMMPYVDGLYDSADWFRQLWAESLGKERDRAGRIVHAGPTPIAARGATDQHSQLQLYAEGPDDKVYLFVSCGDRGAEVEMPAAGRLGEAPEYSYLVGKGMGQLLDAELRGTVASLTRRGRPSGALHLDRVDGPGLGALFMLLEAATAFAGPLYGVDPFDQPGVEEAKRLAHAALGRPGFEEHAAALEDEVAETRYRF